MSTCSAAEIAEKKRIALEKLKSKKAANIKPPTTTTNNNNKSSAITLSKTSNKFYSSSSSDNTNKASEFLRVIRDKFDPNALNGIRNTTQPYIKPQFHNNGEKLKTNQTNKLSPIFLKTVICSCYIITENRFVAEPSQYHQKLIDVFKTMPTKAYDPETKLWSFGIHEYELLHERAAGLHPVVTIGTIPKNVMNLCLQKSPELDYSCLTSLESKIKDSLLPFQKEGVCFGISKCGRVLIADEMGLGKTYQALAIADFYRDDWPVLICCTASTRDSWATHVRSLLPYVSCHHISCLTTNQDYFGDCKVLISSYNMVEKNIDKILEKNFGVIILDESHTLKNNKAKCTVSADRLARQARRVILLSGTPALSRPLELFTQLQMIDRKFFNFIDYTKRYCAGKQTNFGWDASGQSNLKELKVVLSKKYMIRRLKTDVLPQLAEKFRETVYLDPSLVWTTDTSENLTQYAKNLLKSSGSEKEEILIKFYAETASAKAKAVCTYIKNLVKEKTKFIVFAHHQVMMDAITKCLKNLEVEFVRIDGSTRNDLRAGFVKKFQTKSSCLVALLSLRACNAGITLTAAQIVVFAELDWNPSTLAQAESRAHRIGQKGSVSCRYLLANKTADDVIWNMLKTKQDVLNKAGLFSENLQDGYNFAQTTSHKITDYYKSPEKSDENILQTSKEPSSSNHNGQANANSNRERIIDDRGVESNMGATSSTKNHPPTNKSKCYMGATSSTKNDPSTNQSKCYMGATTSTKNDPSTNQSKCYMGATSSTKNDPSTNQSKCYMGATSSTKNDPSTNQSKCYADEINDLKCMLDDDETFMEFLNDVDDLDDEEFANLPY